MVIGEPDSFSFESGSSKITRFFSEFFKRFFGVNSFWRIYTQETNSSLHSNYYRINRISIYDFCNEGLFGNSIQNLSTQNIIRRNCEIPSKRINLHSSTGESQCVAGISESDVCNSLSQSEGFPRNKCSAELIRARVIADFTCTEGESF